MTAMVQSYLRQRRGVLLTFLLFGGLFAVTFALYSLPVQAVAYPFLLCAGDALLKRIMRLNNQDKDEKFVEDNYDKSIEELTWHLIKEQLVKINDIKVEQDDILNMAKETTRAQFAQYGMLSVPEEILDNYAKEMLKKKESIEGLVNRVVETKLASALKTQVTLENKNISAADFNKMFE